MTRTPAIETLVKLLPELEEKTNDAIFFERDAIIRQEAIQTIIAAAKELAAMGETQSQEKPMGYLNDMAAKQHEANATWWHDPATGERIERNKGELLMLMVSEISEAMEGERKNLMDDKLPHRKMVEVELADVLIRIFDYAGAFGYDLDGAVAEKQAFNAQRADHKPENRLAPNGKKW